MLGGYKPAWGGVGDRIGAYVVKANAAGQLVNATVRDFAPSIQTNNKEGYVTRIFKNPNTLDPYIGIGTYKNVSGDGKNDIYIYPIRDDGDAPFSNFGGQILSSNNSDDFVNDAVQFNASSYALVGRFNGNISFMTFAYNATSSITNFSIVKQYPNVTSLTSICALENNQGFAVCGFTSNDKLFVAKLTLTGDIVWQKIYEGWSSLAKPDIAHTYWDGGFVIVGADMCPTSTCITTPAIMKTDRNGNFN